MAAPAKETAPTKPAAPATKEAAPAAPTITGGAMPHETAPATSPVSRPTNVGGMSLTPEQAKQASALARERAGFGEKERASYPDLLEPQGELSRSSQNIKQQVVPLAGTLASLPKDKSIMTSGPAQAIIAPAMSVAQNLAGILGYKLQASDPIALQEEVAKLATRLNANQLSATGQRAFGALQELSKGLPSYLNSPGGQAKLVPQIMTEGQREIDRYNFMRAWDNAAAGERGENANFSKLTSRDAVAAFDETHKESDYAKERQALERMFADEFTVTDPQTKQSQKMTPMAYITKYGASMSPEQKQAFRDRYAKGAKLDILRHFGVN
jgi:hypothetical protein